MARLVVFAAAITRDEDTAAAMQLVYMLAAFAENLADLREAQHRLHQAQAARDVVGQLRAYQLRRVREPREPTRSPVFGMPARRSADSKPVRSATDGIRPRGNGRAT
jgi:hypothetical protein